MRRRNAPAVLFVHDGADIRLSKRENEVLTPCCRGWSSEISLFVPVVPVLLVVCWKRLPSRGREFEDVVLFKVLGEHPRDR